MGPIQIQPARIVSRHGARRLLYRVTNIGFGARTAIVVKRHGTRTLNRMSQGSQYRGEYAVRSNLGFLRTRRTEELSQNVGDAWGFTLNFKSSVQSSYRVVYSLLKSVGIYIIGASNNAAGRQPDRYRYQQPFFSEHAIRSKRRC